MTKAERDQDPAKEAAAGNDVNLALVSVAGFGLLAALVTAVVWSVSAALGVAAGGAIAVANLWVFKRIGRAFLTDSGAQRAIWGVIGTLKFVALLAGVALLLRHDVVAPLPLLIGYLAMPVGITLSTFLAARFQDGS